MNTKIIEKTQYKEVINALKQGEVVSFPTETVMGDVKNRPANKAFPFIVKDKNEVSKYAYVDEKVYKIINKFMPGPLTIILKKNKQNKANKKISK